MDEFLYRYRADLASVHDGDTVTLDLDLGLRVRARVTARLYGPDPTGRAAKDWLAARLADPRAGDLARLRYLTTASTGPRAGPTVNPGRGKGDV